MVNAEQAQEILHNIRTTHILLPTTHAELNSFNARVIIGCISCGKDHAIMVKREDYLEFTQPQSIQRLAQAIFPYLKSAWREMFISRICPACQEMFEPRS
jgi:hypothetical protein